MPLVRVVSVVGVVRPPLVGPTGHPKVELIAEDGRYLVLPFAPTLRHRGHVPRYFQGERVGLRPLLSKAAPNLKELAYTLVIARADFQESVEDILDTLRRFAEGGPRVRFRNFGPSEAGWWRITDLDIADELRQQGTNLITRATVAMTLTEASEVAGSGPLSGGLSQAPKLTPSSPGSYTVTQFDTLWSVSVAAYGTGNKWTVVADLNSITDPRALKVGQVLKIP